ncbi:MAG: magnesium/cobalt transporter CorA [Saprospiraceae bacterium]|nr:magnesium/cobalt transporter CorA [Saprospiraceae bacterium]
MGISFSKKKRRISKKGLPPGSKIYTGGGSENEVSITVHKYRENYLEKFVIHTEEIDEVFSEKENNIWVDIDGIHDVEKVVHICEKLDIHLLHQEDILNVFQRPKLEEEDDYTLLILKMIHPLNEVQMSSEVEQLGFVLKDNILITFQEKTGDVFDPIRERFQKTGSRIRAKNVDYLCYVLFDVVVDSYIENLIKLEEVQDKMEEEMILEISKYDLQNIQALKKVLLEHKKAIWPLKELMPKLLRSNKNWVKEENHKYFYDLHDHVLQAHEMLDSQMEVHNGIKDLYLHRMNREINNVMKMLTIISTIFIPLTFIAGVYGMNFKNMPEIYTEYGYFITVGIMIIIGVSFFVYFRLKKWT